LNYLTLFHEDDPGSFDGVDLEDSEKKPVNNKGKSRMPVYNSGFAKRSKRCAINQKVHNFCELPLDFCASNRPILPDANVQLVLMHHHDAYR